MSSSLHFQSYSQPIACNQSCNDYLWIIGPCMIDYNRSAMNSCGHCQPLNAFNGASHSLLIAGNPCRVFHSWLQMTPSRSVNGAIIRCSPNFFLYYWTTCQVIPGHCFLSSARIVGVLNWVGGQQTSTKKQSCPPDYLCY